LSHLKRFEHHYCHGVFVLTALLDTCLSFE